MVADLIGPYADKDLARMTGVCPRTFKNLRQKQNSPSAATLIALMCVLPEASDAVMKITGRDPARIRANLNDVHEHVQNLKLLCGDYDFNSSRISSVARRGAGKPPGR
jgi:hypothetical protein